MKALKQLSIFVVALVFCGTVHNADGPRLTQSEADEAALGHAGGGTITRRSPRRKDGRDTLEYVIVHDDQRIKLRLDAADGSMLRYERKPVRPSEGPNAAGDGEEGVLTHKQAEDIALERSGGGVVVESEREVKRDGRILYEIEIHKDTMEFEMAVDGRTGSIVKYEEEPMGR